MPFPIRLCRCLSRQCRKIDVENTNAKDNERVSQLGLWGSLLTVLNFVLVSGEKRTVGDKSIALSI